MYLQMLECDTYDRIQDGHQKIDKKMFKMSHFLQIVYEHRLYFVR